MKKKKPLISQGLLDHSGLSRTNEWRPLPDLNRCRRRERAVSWAGLDEGDLFESAVNICCAANFNIYSNYIG